MPLGQVRDFETHLVSRATFGWTRETERDVLDAGWEAWLDGQLAPATIPDPKVSQLLAGYDTLGNSNWQNHVYKDTAEDGWYRLLGERAHSHVPAGRLQPAPAVRGDGRVLDQPLQREPGRDAGATT